MKITNQNHPIKKDTNGLGTFCYIDVHSTTAIKFSFNNVKYEIPDGLYIRIQYLLYGYVNSRVVEIISVAEFKRKYINDSKSFIVNKHQMGERLLLELGIMTQEGFVSLSDNTKINFSENGDCRLPYYLDFENFDFILGLTIEDPIGDLVFRHAV